MGVVLEMRECSASSDTLRFRVTVRPLDRSANMILLLLLLVRKRGSVAHLV